VNSRSRWWNWKTKPIVLVPDAAELVLGEVVRRAATDLDLTGVGRSSPPSRWSSVDFPEPLCPMIATVSPGATSRSAPSSTCSSEPSPPT
jgi:hypothetical protein